MIPSFASETIVITEPEWVEERGKQVKRYPAQGEAVFPVVVQEGSASPSFDLRDAVEIRKVVFMNPSVEVTRHARVTVRGRHYRVYGVPEDWRSPTGLTSHKRLDLVDWEG
ncbi:MAG: hypothetical protein Q4D87_08975 [Actinomycetaceae bacterium]|nr:hypothetical protein [Actinomycetaceae bacterium]